MNMIHLRAQFLVPKYNEMQRVSSDDMVNIIKQKLSRKLAEGIIRKEGIFTQREDAIRGIGTIYTGDCIVMTFTEFEELKEEIERNVMRGMPTIYGGVGEIG